MAFKCECILCFTGIKKFYRKNFTVETIREEERNTMERDGIKIKLATGDHSFLSWSNFIYVLCCCIS